MKKHLIAVLLIAIASHSLLAQCKLDYSNYRLVLDENFDNLNAASDLLARWQFQMNDPNAGAGIEHYDPGIV